LSEFAVLKGMIDNNRMLVAAFYLIALATAFVAISATVIPIVFGKPMKDTARVTADGNPQPFAPVHPLHPPAEPLWSLVPPLFLGLITLILGFYVPQELSDLLHRAAMAVGAE
jgi:NADH:ubiquinone oxidoreductase subunit 5 (subunit L)/multisubunit Na+/H+ antiporter MnhA subunit